MAALIIMTSNASAATPQDCAQIGEDAQRLACFDGIYPRQEKPKQGDLSAAEVAMERRMRLFELGWYYAETVSPIDDTRAVHAGKTADDEYYGPVGTPDTPEMRIRCDNGELSVYFRYDGLYLTTDGGSVRYRVDKRDAKTVKRLEASTNSRAFGFWRGADAETFLADLKGGSKLVVEISLRMGGNAVNTYDIGNLPMALEPIRELCPAP